MTELKAVSTAREEEDRASGQVQGDPMAIFQLGYVSTQSWPLSAAELLDLLNTARTTNEQLGISGVLLHREESFFQVIEGEREAVLALFEKIVKDPRHKRVEVLFEDAASAREFADWRMGFLELDGVDLSLLPGYSDFLTKGVKPNGVLREITRSRRLMYLFRSMA